jgi:hypothetical protein
MADAPERAPKELESTLEVIRNIACGVSWPPSIVGSPHPTFEAICWTNPLGHFSVPIRKPSAQFFFSILLLDRIKFCAGNCNAHRLTPAYSAESERPSDEFGSLAHPPRRPDPVRCVPGDFHPTRTPQPSHPQPYHRETVPVLTVRQILHPSRRPPPPQSVACVQAFG